jgi:hypothetical protein
MTTTAHPTPASAYRPAPGGTWRSTALTRGPWDPNHQHAGPPVALACRAFERVAREQGLAHIARLTANLFRPVPIGELALDVAADYVGRNAAHFSARLLSGAKEVARFTALAQRENDVAVPDALLARRRPMPLRAPADSPAAVFPFHTGDGIGYANLVETRLAQGEFFKGPSAVWFRLRHPLLEGEAPSPYQRVAVAADSGNGISAVLDFSKFVFINLDLTINFLRRPEGEWVCLDAQSHLGERGTGLAESALFDEAGLVGRATQSLAIRSRD